MRTLSNEYEQRVYGVVGIFRIRRRQAEKRLEKLRASRAELAEDAGVNDEE